MAEQGQGQTNGQLALDKERTLAAIKNVHSEIFVDPPPQKLTTQQCCTRCSAASYEQHIGVGYRMIIAVQIFFGLLTIGAVVTGEAPVATNVTCPAGHGDGSVLTVPETVLLFYAALCFASPGLWEMGIWVQNVIVGPGTYIYLVVSSGLHPSCFKGKAVTIEILMIAQICVSTVLVVVGVVLGMIRRIEQHIIRGEADDISVASLDIEL